VISAQPRNLPVTLAWRSQDADSGSPSDARGLPEPNPLTESLFAPKESARRILLLMRFRETSLLLDATQRYKESASHATQSS